MRCPQCRSTKLPDDETGLCPRCGASRECSHHTLIDKDGDTYCDDCGEKMPSIYDWYMAMHEKENPHKYFDETKTGMPYFDNMMENPDYFVEEKGIAWKIIRLTPDEYVEFIESGFWIMDPQRDIRMKERLVPDLVKKYAGLMRGGELFHLPVLEYRITRPGYTMPMAFSQEGHHRVEAARTLGVRTVPVLVVYPSDAEDFEVIEELIPGRIRELIE